MSRTPVLATLLTLCLLGCGTMSGTTADSVVRVALAAAEAGGNEVVRAIDEAAARDDESAHDPPEPRAEGDRLFLCWLDDYGGEELFAPTSERARDRCRALHGQRDEPRHCRCEVAQ